MDCGKVGALLYRLRTEMSMTQQQVADRLNISNKTISKWERGLGCPDVSLLGELSGLFQVNIEKILNGSVRERFIEIRRSSFVQSALSEPHSTYCAVPPSLKGSASGSPYCSVNAVSNLRKSPMPLPVGVRL